MKKLILLAAAALFASHAQAHHPGHSIVIKSPQATGSPGSGVSGQGQMKFRVLYTSAHLPAAAVEVLKAAHGGFAVDRRPGRGEVYFSLPGAGIIQISADMKSIKMVQTHETMKGVNLHNTTIWYSAQGTPYLVFPANREGKVFTTALDGSLLNTLDPPVSGDQLGNTTAETYFAEGGKFMPTDVEEMDGLYYVATGYSPLDYVITAKIASFNPFKAAWHDLAFGGKGSGPGQFGTGHGITVPPGQKRIDVADRPNSQIDRFTRYGHYLSTLDLPKGSLPCDIDYLDRYAAVPCLDGPDKTKGAPIYILEDDRLISTVMPKEELGLENFLHIHNAVLHKVGQRYYLIVQAWNPGDFAILEQVL